MTVVAIKRVYAPAEPQDGLRILVDRLWPRGVRKEDLALDLWCRQAAPSADLRRAWHRDGADFASLAARYRAELAQSPGMEELASAAAGHDRVTLLYASRDPEHNHARVLGDALRERLG